MSGDGGDRGLTPLPPIIDECFALIIKVLLAPKPVAEESDSSAADGPGGQRGQTPLLPMLPEYPDGSDWASPGLARFSHRPIGTGAFSAFE